MTIIMYTVKRICQEGTVVRVTREQSAAHREKILDVAGTLFRERGFDGIGVADIMKRAGLTHGGFYGHFASKDDLAAEITERILTREGWLERLTGTSNPSIAEVIRKYLSTRHRDDAGRGCLFAALGSDVARRPEVVGRNPRSLGCDAGADLTPETKGDRSCAHPVPFHSQSSSRYPA